MICDFFIRQINGDIMFNSGRVLSHLEQENFGTPQPNGAVMEGKLSPRYRPKRLPR